MAPRRPNILFIQADQLAAETLGAYGNPVCKTPHIDALAETGTLFENAYCNFPLCAPSRFSMATGLLPSKIGAFDNAAELPAAIPTYAHYLRALGYQTCLVGKMHFVGPDQLHGFEKRLVGDIYPGDFEWTADWSADGFQGATDKRMLTQSGICARSVQIDYDEQVTHRAARQIFDLARSADGRPFFLQVSYTHPHDPYLCQPRHWDLHDGADIPAPRARRPADADNDPHSLRVLRQHGLDGPPIADEDIMRARRAYYGSVGFIDDQVGVLLEALDRGGQAENTAIVFASDHGEMLGERGLWLKKTFFEPALKVPLIIHAPDRFAAGRADTVCSLVDLLPTFMGLASDGAWPGAVEPLDGADLAAFAGSPGEERTLRAELLCEGVLAPIFLIRRGRHKFVTSRADPDMLFDLRADPDELNNLASDADQADRVRGLREEVESLWDSEALTARIVQSQRRRILIRGAHSVGRRPNWDFEPVEDEGDRWYRGRGNYNDWAFDYLPATEAT